MNRPVADLRNTREILERYGLKAKKKYGQNFLTDPGIVQEIVDRVEAENVIEVGPGLGALTEQLCDRGKKVTAYEIDTDMCQVLRETVPEAEVINEDILNVDLTGFRGTLISNLPYYITSEILLKVFLSECEIDRVIVMIQKEVAERFLTRNSKKDYTPLNIFAQYRTDRLIKVCRVDRSCFLPRPNVDSTVLEFDLNDRMIDEGFRLLVERSFAQRRKLLLRNLKPHYDIDEQLLEKLGISTLSRAEDLEVDDFIRIYAEVGK